MIYEPDEDEDEREPDPPHYTFWERVVLGLMVLLAFTGVGLLIYGFMFWR